MQILKTEAIAKATSNLKDLTGILSAQKATNDAALVAVAKELGSSLAAGEGGVTKTLKLDVTPNDTVLRGQFIQTIELMAPDADGGIPVSETDVRKFLTDPAKKTVSRNIRLVTD
jgi:hypothetical protein